MLGGCTLLDHPTDPDGEPFRLQRTGFEDRIGVYELLLVTESLRQLIASKARHDEIQELAVNQGMRTLRDSGIHLVAEDVTTISEILRNIYAI